MSISAENFDYSAAVTQFSAKLQSLDLNHDGKISFAEAQRDASIFSMFNAGQPSSSPIGINEFKSLFQKKIQNSAPGAMKKFNCSAQMFQNGFVKDSKYESSFFDNLQDKSLNGTNGPKIYFNS